MAQKLLDNRSHLYVRRVHDFFQRYHALAERDVTLSQAFSELALLIEVLQHYEQELHKTQEQHQDAYAALEAEHQYTMQLFEAAPAVYVVLRLDGTFRRVNQAAREVLQNDERALVGRALTYFVAEGQRRTVQTFVNTLPQHVTVQYINVDVQPPNGSITPICFAAVVARSPLGRPQELRLLGQPYQK